MTDASQRVPIGLAVSLGLIMVLGPASIDMYLPSMPEMAQQFGTEFSAMQLTLTVFLLAMGAGQLLFGPVIDAFGRRWPLLIALVVYALTSAWAAMATSVESLIFARFIQGLASSLAIVTAMSSVRDVTEGVIAAQLFALLMTIQGIGPVLAPAFGGVVGSAWGWRAVFYVLAALGLLVLLNTIFRMRETLPVHKRSNLQLGTVLRTYVSILSSAAFVLPALSLSLVFFFLFFYIGGASYTYQANYGVTPRSFGLIFGATGIAVLLGAMGSAKLVARFKIEKLALLGVLGLLVGAVVSTVSAFTGVGLIGVAAGMFIALCGLGIGEATLMAIALATRNTALGASAAILGAFPLLLGAAATPLAAIVAERGAVQWLLALVAIGIVASGLTWVSVRRVAKSGVQVHLQHG
ncbi:multidrug effflux MFS transporter [Lampropedia puyangensis]|uniref:Bcr/CflA family efflux transporter n=1 Tax=Lampropedia puyangensis TaxID=1330072 RepID=A0A4S8F4G8_9BURK|nr:Bcr/CflA family efflux MFS transporter [Lampropedia puyangensis]THU01987.1 multidrug effflux MFS transporter [Lampropedia puyangensis]